MRRGSIEKGEGEDISEINVVPLADISLVLLIILMLITPMAMQSMINISASQSAKAVKVKDASPEKPLIVEVRPDGFWLNQNKMETAVALQNFLAGELSRKNDRTVIITAAKGVRHGMVVTALDMSKQAGAGKLSLVKRATR
ncbi:MAG: biopolymer transporter ExbD [Elusimicrobia bacterium]|jgi:biopolymer transport protein ExbD|nr:biopolymer transporter ExbD [Elusimicrobiota bacterium]